MSLRLSGGALACALLAGCAQPAAPPPKLGPTPVTQGRVSHGPLVPDEHVAPFATLGWEPFSRQDAVAIAQREWRLFGERVDDDPPGSRPPPLPEDKPERQAGLWQRVGEYWWEGQDPSEREAAWTGMHDADGRLFPAEEDGQYAWSAAFISYVMRIAGAGPDFPYSPNHSTYINASVTGRSPLVQGYAPQDYAPLPGDLICTGRDSAAGLRFRDLPYYGPFPAHCDIVVVVAPGQLTVIGGNVDDAVTVKHVPISDTGLLAGPDGKILDTRYPWLAVLKVAYAK